MGNNLVNPVSIYGACIFAQFNINGHNVYMIGEDHKNTESDPDFKYDYRVEDFSIPENAELWLEYSDFEKKNNMGSKGKSALTRIRNNFSNNDKCIKIDSRFDDAKWREFSYDMVLCIRDFYMKDDDGIPQNFEKYKALYLQFVNGDSLETFKDNIIKLYYNYHNKEPSQDSLVDYFIKYFNVLDESYSSLVKIREELLGNAEKDWTNLLKLQGLTSTFGSLLLDVELIKKINNTEKDIVIYMGGDHIRRLIDGLKHQYNIDIQVIENDKNIITIERNELFSLVKKGGNDETIILQCFTFVLVSLLILIVLYLMYILIDYLYCECISSNDIYYIHQLN